MKHPKINAERRKFVTAGAVFIPAAALVGTRAFADLVDPSTPQATALKYIAVSEVEGQDCTNCALYQPTGDDKGTCPLFAGLEVEGPAWCSAWVAKQ